MHNSSFFPNGIQVTASLRKINLCLLRTSWKHGKQLSSGRRVMLVISHPDDEVMFFGPTILGLVQVTLVLRCCQGRERTLSIKLFFLYKIYMLSKAEIGSMRFVHSWYLFALLNVFSFTKEWLSHVLSIYQTKLSLDS